MYRYLELTVNSLAPNFRENFVTIVPPVDDVVAIGNPITESSRTILLAGTDQEEIYSTFLNLFYGKALNADNLKIKPIKFVIATISPGLTHIYN